MGILPDNKVSMQHLEHNAANPLVPYGFGTAIKIISSKISGQVLYFKWPKLLYFY